MFLNALLFLYIFFSILLIIFILFDKGKGSEIGALSTTNDFLNVRSSNSFFSKFIIFFILVLLFLNFSMTYLKKNNTFLENKPTIDIFNDKK